MIATILVLIVLILVWRWYTPKSPLDKLPGPPQYPIIGSALPWIWMTPRNLFVMVRQYAKRYGRRYVVRILNRTYLNIQTYKDVEVVLSHPRLIKKAMPYSFLQSWLGDGLLLSNGTKWHKRRKILTPTFHFNILKNFALVFEEKSCALVHKLKQLQGTYVDLLPIISDNTLFMICETAMGTQLDSDKSTAAITYKKSILQMGTILISRLTKVWLYNEDIFQNLPIGKMFHKHLNQVNKFTDNVILERRKHWSPGQDLSDESYFGINKKLAMLDILLEAENRGEIDLEGIREEVNTFMFEGHDTTARAIILGLHLLANDEKVQEYINEEYQSIVGDSKHNLSISDLAKMKYLESVIKEILRLYPSVPSIARTLTEDIMLEDLLVPKGTDIVINIYDLHRQPDVFPEPEEFKPERFYTNSQLLPYSFVPFSAGPRNCIGQKFAMLQMKSVISAICRNFKLSPREPGERPELIADILIRPSAPVYVKFTPR